MIRDSQDNFNVLWLHLYVQEPWSADTDWSWGWGAVGVGMGGFGFNFLV